MVMNGNEKHFEFFILDEDAVKNGSFASLNLQFRDDDAAVVIETICLRCSQV